MTALLSDMAYTAGVGRSHFARRAGVAFTDADSLRNRLSAMARMEVHPDPRRAPEPTPPKTAFVHAGEGSAHTGMGREFYDGEPVVRAVLDRCDAVLVEERGGASLLDVAFGRPGGGGGGGWPTPSGRSLPSTRSHARSRRSGRAWAFGPGL